MKTNNTTLRNVAKPAALAFMTMFALTSCDNNGSDVDPMAAETSVMLYTSNNADGDIMTFDMSDMSNVKSKKIETTSSAADGIYFDANTDVAFQASRSELRLEGFTGIKSLIGDDLGLGGIVKATASLTSSADMKSPRETAVKDDFYVVADNADVDGNANTPDGRLFVYQKSGNSFALRNIITTDFKLWGITFIGNDLYAVVDADNELAVYTNFLSNNTSKAIVASKRIEIEGIVRTHGITYDQASNTMIMTDIGSATNTQDDGGFHVITNFMSKFNSTANGGKLSNAQQIRVAGSMTNMGNPVDVAYNGTTGVVYIAEAGNGGGKVLAFSNVTSGGNISPSYSADLKAASAIYLSKK